MTSKLKIEYPPLPTNASATAPSSDPPTPEEQIKSLHSHLVYQLTTLQASSLIRGESNTYYHKFLIPYLPTLLTRQRAEGVVKFRHAFTTTALEFTRKNGMDERYTNFARALSWALDHAESVVYDVGEDAELRVMKALCTIFHLVTRFCNQEWNNGSGVAAPIVEIPEEQSPSKRDPVYHQQIGRSRKRVEQGYVEDAPDDVIETYPKGLPRSFSSLFNGKPHYIRRDGKQITPFACIQQGSGTCFIPFEFSLKEKSNNDEQLDVPSKCLEITYRDNTSFEFIPMQDVWFLREKISRHLAEDEKASSEKKSTGCVEVDGLVYDTLLEISKQAYTEKHLGLEPNFVTGIDQPLPKKRIQIRIPVLPSCHVRVIDGNRFMECPIWKAVETCQHDLSGYAKLKVKFVEQIDATKIQIFLIGMIVERDLSNYDDAIFDLLELQERNVEEDQQRC